MRPSVVANLVTKHAVSAIAESGQRIAAFAAEFGYTLEPLREAVHRCMLVGHGLDDTLALFGSLASASKSAGKHPDVVLQLFAEGGEAMAEIIASAARATKAVEREHVKPSRARRLSRMWKR